MDSLVKIVSVKDVPGFDITTLTPHNRKVVTYTVGTNGPFTLTYQAAAFTDVNVQQDIQKEVDTLRAIGAIPPVGTY